MAKKYLFIPGLLLLSALFLTLVSSCSEDDTGKYEKENYVSTYLVGEWYCDNSNHTRTSRIIISFNEDGTLHYEYNSFSDVKPEDNIHIITNGLFNMDGDKIRIGIMYDNITEWTEYDMDLNGNTLTLIQDNGNTVTFGAVVQSLTINVGETLKFSWTGKNGVPLTYSSSANMLASVSDDGVITALRSGMVYITGHCPNGENIIYKLDILDPVNGSIPNFYNELKKSRSEIMKSYEGRYVQEDNAYYCNVGSNKIKQIDYNFNKIGLVKQVYIAYWFDTDISDLLSSLENGASGFKPSTTPNAFLKEMNGREIVCIVHPQAKLVTYYVNQNGFEEFEEYIFYDSLNELLDYHRSWYDDENYESVYLNSSGDNYVLLVDPNNEEDQEIFERLFVYFDGDNITEIDAVAKPSVTRDEIKQWAEINYPYKYQFPGDNFYSHLWRQDWWNMNPVFRFDYIRFTGGANAGKAGIRYKKNFINAIRI